MQQRETRSFVKDGFVQLQRNNEEHTEKNIKYLISAVEVYALKATVMSLN